MPGLKILYQITMEGPFHVGSGYRRGLIHRTLLRQQDGGHLYLSGSAIKGCVRHLVENLARIEGFGPCEAPVAAKMCWGEVRCVVCHLFGSPYKGEALFFDNAYLRDDYRESYASFRQGREKMADYQHFERMRVAIDRRTATALEGQLFTSEYGVERLVFEGEIEGTAEGNSQDLARFKIRELHLLLQGLKLLEAIGAEKSVGIGRCRVDVQEVALEGRKLASEELDLILYGRGVETHQREGGR